jgi:subtilisin family serine protease
MYGVTGSSRALVVLVLALGVLQATSAWAGEGTLKSSALAPLYEEYAAHAAGSNERPFVPADRSTRVIDDSVAIDAFADDDVQALVADLTALGMHDVAVAGRAVSGQLPLSAIPALDGLATLRFAAPSLVGRRVGLNTSQGDHAMRADVARTMFGVTGAGVKVGVLSDSFNCLAGADKNVADGDLSPVTVVQESASCADGTDEGRAMLEIVHDVAPGAQLLFASGNNGLASFASNIIALKNRGANVIVDDLAYFSEPMFQDGIVAQAVDTVAAQGAVYLSATGNEGRRGYESSFRAGSTFADGDFPPAPGAPSGTHFLGGVAHNFAPSAPADHMQKITIPSGRELIVSLQWDSPFFSVSGPPGSLNDLDVYLLDPTGTMVVRRSVRNNVGGDAAEVLSYVNSGPTATFNLMIVKFTGADPGRIKYVQLGSATISIDEFDTRSPTVFGHPAAAGAIAVGAAWYAQTPEFGVTPPRKETYSSAGPVSILFDTAGNRFASPLIRAKPDVVAPDGVVTASVSSAFTAFFGTSAAAPHAAGVAALLLERHPGLSPANLSATLKNTAVDMATPGFDDDTGAGLIQADAALQFVSLPLTLGLTLDRTTVSPGDRLQVGISISNPGAALFQDFYFFVAVPPALSASLGCPAGDALVFLTNAFSSVAVRCAATASPRTFPPLTPNMSIAGASTTSTQNFFSTVWPFGLPAGTYTVFIATTLPGALADGVIGPADVGAFAVGQFQAR